MSLPRGRMNYPANAPDESSVVWWEPLVLCHPGHFLVHRPLVPRLSVSVWLHSLGAGMTPLRTLFSGPHPIPRPPSAFPLTQQHPNF